MAKINAKTTTTSTTLTIVKAVTTRIMSKWMELNYIGSVSNRLHWIGLVLLHE